MGKLCTCSMSMLLSAACVLPAIAQTGAAAEGLELEEIVVTAEKRGTDMQKTAISMQVYSGDELKQQGKKRIDEMLSGIVGVQAQDTQVGAAYSFRGVETGTTGAPGTNAGATVALLIDGVYQNRTEVVRGGTLDVAQVEVMRGTQSTNIGGSSLAGAVSLVTNKPVFEYQASGSMEVGNYHLLNMDGVLNVPLSDNQALRIAYASNKRDGYLSSGAGDSDSKNARLKYRWQVSNDLDVVLTTAYQNVGGNGVSAGVLTYAGTWQPYSSTGTYDQIMGYPRLFGHVASDVTFRDRSNPWDDGYPADTWPNNPFRDTNIASYSADINWNTGIGTLTVTPSFQHATFRSIEPPRGESWMGENRKQVTSQIEARLTSNADAPFEWLVGTYFYNTNETGTFMNATNPGGMGCSGSEICFAWDNRKENSTLTKSIFANATYPVLDTLRLLAGLRYSKDDKTHTNSADGPNAIAGSALGPDGGDAAYVYSSQSGSWSGSTYRAGIEYDVLPQSMVYLTYGTGYQPGVVDAMNVASNTAPSKKNTTEQLTLGSKNRFFDNKVQFNLEAFLSRFKDRPFSDSLTIGGCSGNSSGVLTDAGQTFYVMPDLSCVANRKSSTMPFQESRGVDLELNLLPTTNDRIDLALEYLDATYGDAPEGVAQMTGQDLLDAGASGSLANANALVAQYNALVSSYKGVILQNSPKLSGNATYQHRFDLPGGSSLTPRVNVEYKDKYWAQGGGPAPSSFTDVRTALNNDSIVRQDAYSLWNVYATWQKADSKFSISGYVRNIENEAVQTNIVGEMGSNLAYVALNSPRTFGVTFNASF